MIPGETDASTVETEATLEAGAPTGRERLSPGDLLGSAFATYFRGFPLFTAVTAVILSPYLALRYSEADRSPDASFHLQLLIYLLQAVATAAVLFGVFRRLRGERASPLRCLTIALERLLQVIGVAVITLLAGVALGIGPSLAAAAAGPVASAVVFGLLFGLVVSALYTAPAVVVVERLGVLAAVRRNSRLIRGNYGRIFAVWFVLTALGVLLFWLANELLWRARDRLDSESIAAVRFAADAVLAVVFTALHAVAAGLVYHRLRVSVEEADADELAAVFD